MEVVGFVLSRGEMAEGGMREVVVVVMAAWEALTSGRNRVYLLVSLFGLDLLIGIAYPSFHSGGSTTNTTAAIADRNSPTPPWSNFQPKKTKERERNRKLG